MLRFEVQLSVAHPTTRKGWNHYGSQHIGKILLAENVLGGVGRFLSLTGIVLIAALTTACGEDPPVPVEGSVSGTVTLEGAGLSDVTVDLSGGESTSTGGDGTYSFSNVIEGSYTVTISGYPADAEFSETSQSVSINEANRSPTADFAGTYTRTSSVTGTVTVEGMGLGGIMVVLTGMESQSRADRRRRWLLVHRPGGLATTPWRCRAGTRTGTCSMRPPNRSLSPSARR